MKLHFSPAIAVAAGLIVLLGYFINLPMLLALRLAFVDWASTLAAVALLLGLFNLLGVHGHKLVNHKPGWLYSLFLIAGLVTTFGIVATLGPAADASVWIFQYIQSPLETALAALLAVTLVLAGVRLLRRRRSVLSVVFLVTAMLVLIGSAPIPGEVGGLLAEVRAWVAQVPAVAGARGVLIGVALGAIATGLRVLLAADRPYGE